MCSFPACGRAVNARGFCQSHYNQHRRGEPLREIRPWRGDAAAQSCVNGHEYTPENTYFTASGGRRCRTCRNAGVRAYKGRAVGWEREVPAEKQCRRCELELPAEAFRPVADTRDGLSSRCRKCLNRRAREREHGLPDGGYVELLAGQGGVCAVCQHPEEEFGVLSVDHDHETGQVRGLLCQPCNLALGLLQERPEVIDAASAYVSRGGT